MANNEHISKALGFDVGPLIEPGVAHELMVGTAEVLPAESIEKPTPEQILRDFNVARENVLEVIETTKEAMNDVASIAAQSQDDKYYDSLTSVLKVMLEANRDLLTMHEQIQRLTDKLVGTVNKVQNNLFVGSTADLTKFLADLRKKDE